MFFMRFSLNKKLVSWWFCFLSEASLVVELVKLLCLDFSKDHLEHVHQPKTSWVQPVNIYFSSLCSLLICDGSCHTCIGKLLLENWWNIGNPRFNLLHSKLKPSFNAKQVSSLSYYFTIYINCLCTSYPSRNSKRRQKQWRFP